MSKSISRRQLLAMAAVGSCGTAYARFVEPKWLEFSQRECRLPKLTHPVSLAHLSDFHASKVVPQSLIEHAVDLAIASKPDIICLTGDYVTGSTGFDTRWYKAVLSKLPRQAPTFAVLGNHDGGVWAESDGGFRGTEEVTRLLESSGIQVLENRSLRVQCNGAELQLAGVGDFWAANIDIESAFADTDSRYPTILLSHNPDTKVLFAKLDWELMLSGHTHGGQVVMPVLGLCHAPVEDKHYLQGLKPWRNRWIHVSRGVGNVLGVRFNCRPEVTKLRLLPALSTSNEDVLHSSMDL